MIVNVVRVGLLRLWHGKLEMLLVFVVPVVFFTIFACIFDRQVGRAATTVRLTTVDLDQSPLSKAVLERIETDPMVRHEPSGIDPDVADWGNLESACESVLHGRVKLAVVVPAGWSASLLGGSPQSVSIAADTSDPVAPKIVSALVQQAIGMSLAETQLPKTSDGAAGPRIFGAPVQLIDLLAEGKASPVVSQYAAGIAVMFLLFTASGMAGSLLEEEESQTLERLMCSQLSMTRLILGKWFFLTLLGSLQVGVMFAWAQAAFGVAVLDRLAGFAVMTFATAGAAASLALVMAAACRTRAQLNAVSTILILTMSAVGGSMVPRYVMSESMQQLGRATFNAWAIDGYTKIFWRDLPIAELAPELMVMGGFGAGLLVIARVLAMRWETV